MLNDDKDIFDKSPIVVDNDETEICVVEKLDPNAVDNDETAICVIEKLDPKDVDKVESASLKVDPS